MFPGFCTLIVVININRLQISINRLQIPPRYVRLGLRLGFICWVLVTVRVRVRLELRSVLRLWLRWVRVRHLRLS